MNKDFDMEGSKEPTTSKQYLAQDGLYYNGYCGSPDWGLNFKKEMNEAVERVLQKLLQIDKPIEDCIQHSFMNYEGSLFEYCRDCGFTQKL